MKIRFDLLGNKATLCHSEERNKNGEKVKINLDYNGKRIVLAIYPLKQISIKEMYDAFYNFSADVCDWAFNGKNEKEVAEYLGTDEHIKEIRENYEKFVTMFPNNIETISKVNEVANKLYDKLYKQL